MKQILTSKMLRKLLILSCLLVGLVIVASTGNQTVEAARCCSTCPGGGDPIQAEENCYNQCGDYNACFYTCRDQAFACYATCSISC